MMYKAKVAICSETRTKHSTRYEHHVDFLNVKTCWYVKKPLGFKRLNPLTPDLPSILSIFFDIASRMYTCAFIPRNTNVVTNSILQIC